MWKRILKRSGKMTNRSKKLVDSVITTTPKSINTIIDDMYNEIDKMKGSITGANTIPTRHELSRYLSSNYSMVQVSKRTGRPAIGGENRYYRE
tara:strand:+ start:156 stop:434 length:279 start_codon:yes stop_codon:yes gene_type:complete